MSDALLAMLSTAWPAALSAGYRLFISLFLIPQGLFR
jgi:hypothetical protein